MCNEKITSFCFMQSPHISNKETYTVVGLTHCSNNQSNHQLNFPATFSPDIGYI